MRPVSRRRFLQHTGIGLAATGYLTSGFSGVPGFAGGSLHANALDLPVGLQLYTVRDLLGKDYDGTIKQIGKLGYQEVELFGPQTRSAADLKALFDSAGLKAVSAHYNVQDLQGNFAEKIADAKALGLQYMICAFPWLADPSRVQPQPKDGGEWFAAVMKNINLDDFKYLADLFNKSGELTKKAGIQFGYHNHNIEFRSYGGVTAFDELLRLTDASLVKFEMDCGWVVISGNSPEAYLTKHKGRFPLLHVKDVKPGVKPSTTIEGDAPTTPVGGGTIDWKKLFVAARASGVKHYFVEQETFDGPPLDALKASYDYLHALKV
jgi:sugar phosphate isomerase/epimerase